MKNSKAYGEESLKFLQRSVGRKIEELDVSDIYSQTFRIREYADPAG